MTKKHYRAYGIEVPLIPIPHMPVTVNRAPSSTDRNFALGDVWIHEIDPNTRAFYFFAGSNAAGNAIWNLASPGASDVDTLSGNGGAAIAPAAGNIDISGAGGGAITFSNGGVGQMNAQVEVDGVTVSIVGNQLVAAAGVAQDITTDTGVNVTNPIYSCLAIQVAAGATPLSTRGTAANAMQIEVQRSQALAVPTITANGVCHFDSADFSVDADGFVSALGASPITGITTTSDGAGQTQTIIKVLGGAVAGCYQVECELVGFNTTTPAGGLGWYSLSGGFRTDGVGPATKDGTTEDKEVGEGAAMAGANVLFTINGNDLDIEVVGIAAQVINWRAEAFTIFVS